MDQEALPPGNSPITIPDLGVGQEPICLVNWLVKPPAQVISGERLVELLVQGCVLQLEAETDGRLNRLAAESGSTVRCGEIIGWILSDAPAA
jgi:pyruvate/2-oxoglutarate dehydrogenase complex dihydrolipoamide acyltransferase (E2) component